MKLDLGYRATGFWFKLSNRAHVLIPEDLFRPVLRRFRGIERIESLREQVDDAIDPYNPYNGWRT